MKVLDAEGNERDRHSSYLRDTVGGQTIDLTNLNEEVEEKEQSAFSSPETAKAQNETNDELDSDSTVKQEEEAAALARTARFQYNGGRSFCESDFANNAPL